MSIKIIGTVVFLVFITGCATAKNIDAVGCDNATTVCPELIIVTQKNLSVVLSGLEKGDTLFFKANFGENLAGRYVIDVGGATDQKIIDASIIGWSENGKTSLLRVVEIDRYLERGEVLYVLKKIKR